MDIRELRYFIEVAREQNLTRAAKNLYLSQPALSRSIKKIEDEFGVKLFTSVDRRTVLTERGSRIYPLAQDLLMRYDDVIDAFQSSNPAQEGQISLAMPLINTQHQFLKMYLEFFQKYPNIRLNIYEKGDHDTEEAVFEGDVDIGIVMCPSQPGRFNEINILTTEVYALVGVDKPYASKDFITLTELADELIFMQSDDYALFHEVTARFRSAGIVPHIGSTSARREFLVELARGSGGVVLLPYMLLTEPINGMCAKPFRNPIHCGLTVITRRKRELSPAAELLISEIRGYFAEIQRSLPVLDRPPR